MALITRYLVSEILKTTFGVLLILLLIGLSNEFVSYLAKAAAGELSATFVAKIVLYNLPMLLGMLLPLAFFLGVVLAYGRLYAESEMTVLMACGVSLWQLIRITLLPAILLTFVTLSLHFWLIPQSTHLMDTLIEKAQADLMSRLLEPGRFQISSDGRAVFFAEKVAPDRFQASGIFIAQLQQGNESLLGTNTSEKSVWNIITSENGKQLFSPEWEADYLILANGHRYAGIPGQKDFSITHFKEFGLRMEDYEPASTSIYSRPLPTVHDLWISNDPVDRAELAWRIALAVSVLVVAILAVPLCAVSPRKGKYAALLPAVILIMGYCNLLVLGRAWLIEGIMPLSLGLWWVHALGLLVAFILIAWRLAWFRRLRW